MGEGDLKELRDLVEFLKASGVAEFDMERPELKVRLTFAQATAATSQAASAVPAGGLDMAQLARLMAAAPSAASAAPAALEAVATPAAAVAPSETAKPSAETEVDEDAGLYVVKSPLVGTFYDSPSPGSELFVKPGEKVVAGKVVCIVEAMKIMNEIECDVAGEIVKVYAKAGQPVEYGQKLFGVRA